jgi:predicted aspartyl protease
VPFDPEGRGRTGLERDRYAANGFPVTFPGAARAWRQPCGGLQELCRAKGQPAAVQTGAPSLERAMPLSRRGFLASAAWALAAWPPRRPQGGTLVPLFYDEHGGLFVEARIDGREPVRLILDTGASRSTISAAYAAELGLELSDGGEVEGSAGVVAARAAAVAIEVGGLEPLRIEALVYDFAHYDGRCAGILGRELLERAPFQIRYRARELVWDAALPEAAIPMRLDKGIPRITAELQGKPVDLRIDTGASLAPGADAYLNLTGAQARELGLTGTPVAVFTATGTGSATLELPVHRLEAAEVAGVRLARPFAIVQPAVGYFAREDAVGFLGNSVLDKLDPYLDYARGEFAASRPTD